MDTKRPLTLGRIVSYLVGLTVLAVGLSLAAKTGLGTSSLTAIPFVLSVYFGVSFGDATFVLFILFVTVQIVLRWDKRAIVPALLQLPLSLVSTRIMNLVQKWVDLSGCSFAVRFGFLLLAVVLIGVGSGMSLDAHLVPNPGDGFVQAIAERAGRPLGTMKNVVDITSVCTAAVLALLLLGNLGGIGIGNVVTMLGVGRVIALYNKVFVR